ncbi:hypothetical protein HYALB_00013067 [Hymenoscyphus albidus]|uniref:DUF6594 domain-containing protein n=1 Tax=Hymenoscyphus albidus TaxID=595503 RepID=A0A9N9QAY9_9HELO|nr:hypothetical protein HYALB_00013067 [Hymenoscyphus albidus]
MRFFARSSSLEDPSSPTSPQNPSPKTASASAALKSTYSYINPLPPTPTPPSITPPKPALSILPTYPITTSTSREASRTSRNDGEGSSASRTSRNDGEGSSVYAQTQSLASSVYVQSPHTSEKSRRLLEVYDPKVAGTGEVLAGKEMVMKRVVEDVLWCAVRVQRHEWVLGAGSEMFGELKTVERWDVIHTDIQRYVQALATYEHLSSQDPKTQLLDLCSLTTWRQIHRLGRTLATLECAHHHLSKPYNESYNESLEPIIQELTHSLSTSITTLCNSTINSNSNSKTKTLPFPIQVRKSSQSSQTRSTRIVPRSTIATLAGCALIVPVLLIVLGSEMVCGLFTTSSFALAVGLVLACRLREGEREDVGRVVVVYLGVWMVLQAFEYGAGVSVSA